MDKQKLARSYQNAIQALNTLQNNASTIEAIRKSGARMNELAKREMIDWVHRTGYDPPDFNQLRPIHIAGTKGKGSTSAFVSYVLREYNGKIGLYTSPHLRYVRERIQINNEPLTEEQFAKYFYETWDRMGDSRPTYFRFLTLMAFHTFMSEGVDTAVVECGIGGEYDSTNFIVQPSCTGITSLGIDHTAVLGNTIEEIAWHKGGIMKRGAPGFTAWQPESAMQVLYKRAEDVGTTLTQVSPYEGAIGLAGEFQKTNAGVAVALASHHLGAPLSKPVPGLEKTRLQGRCEIRHEDNITWYLDCAHTQESIQFTGKWFSQTCKPGTRVLLFNQQTRDANALVRTLHHHASQFGTFSHAVFCTNFTSTQGYKPDMQSINVEAGVVEQLEVQKSLASTYAEVNPGAKIVVKKSIEEAVNWCRDMGQVQVLVTGSVHLVGGVLEVLEADGR